MSDEYDTVHAQSSRKDKRGRDVTGRFDTVLVQDGQTEYVGVKGTSSVRLLAGPMRLLVAGHRVAQVRVIFSLPPEAACMFPPHRQPPKYLAYVEWFSSFEDGPRAPHMLYRIKRSLYNGARLVSVIPLQNVRRGVHLIPSFGPIAPREWTSRGQVHPA